MYAALVFLILVHKALGHGMMLEPPNRSSLWRFNLSDVYNYNDNENFCGGFAIQTENGGNCGVCGDAYSDPHPQNNENTGKFGAGVVVEQYEVGSVIDVLIKLTANHLGTFTYSLCVLEDIYAPESGEDCFMPLVLEDGSTMYNVTKEEFDITNRVQLPSNVTCDRCVLRWHYQAGRTIENLNSRVKIGNCNKPPCRLRKDSVVSIDLKFKPEHDVKKLVNTVNANILGIPFPFAGVDGEDACQNIYSEDGTTKVGCNLKAGQEYLYKNTIEVLKIYPRVKTVVHWALTEPQGQDVICFEVPARITN